MFVALKPRAERDNVNVVIQRLRAATNDIPGIQVYFRSVQNLNVGGRPTRAEYQYTLTSSDTDVLYRVAPEMLAADRRSSIACATSTPTSICATRR